MRIHPLLHFTEKDIWKYIKNQKIPYVSLYDKGYRSLGEKEFTKPAASGGGERSGRQKDQLPQHNPDAIFESVAEYKRIIDYILSN